MIYHIHSYRNIATSHNHTTVYSDDPIFLNSGTADENEQMKIVYVQCSDHVETGNHARVEEDDELSVNIEGELIQMGKSRALVNAWLGPAIEMRAR